MTSGRPSMPGWSCASSAQPTWAVASSRLPSGDHCSNDLSVRAEWVSCPASPPSSGSTWTCKLPSRDDRKATRLPSGSSTGELAPKATQVIGFGGASAAVSSSQSLDW